MITSLRLKERKKKNSSLMKLVDKSYTIIFLRRSACIKVTSCKLYFEREREREREEYFLFGPIQVEFF